MLRYNVIKCCILLSLLTLGLISTSPGISYSHGGNAILVDAKDLSHLKDALGEITTVNYRVSQLGLSSPASDQNLPKTMAEPIFPSSRSSIPSIGVTRLSYAALPDLSVSVNLNGTTCNQVSFTVSLSPDPSYPSPEGNQMVRVRVLSDISGTTEAVGEVLLAVPASGGSTSATLGFPIPLTISATSFSDNITVVVDPENEIAETNEANNSVTVQGACLG